MATPIVALEDAFGVGVYDEAVMCSGVKEHAVGGFRADAIDGQKAFVNGGGFALKHSFQAGVVLFNEHIDKVTEALGLDVEIAGGADELS